MSRIPINHSHELCRFLHVKLQLEALRHCISIRDAEETLEQFPPDTGTIYSKTWERILAQGEKHAGLAKLVFLWLLYGYGDMTIDTLRHVVATCPETNIYDPKRLVPEALLVSVCCGLVAVDNVTRHARLIREFPLPTLDLPSSNPL
jgi:ankyrin repeat domain-containing protein 50